MSSSQEANRTSASDRIGSERSDTGGAIRSTSHTRAPSLAPCFDDPPNNNARHTQSLRCGGRLLSGMMPLDDHRKSGQGHRRIEPIARQRWRGRSVCVACVALRRRLLVAKETKRLPIGLVCRVCSVCCVWPPNSEADRVSAWRPACVGCAACVRFIITGFRETIEVRLVRSTETESKAANQSTKGTFLHEANPLFTPIGQCVWRTPNDRVGSLGDPGSPRQGNHASHVPHRTHPTHARNAPQSTTW